MLARIPFKVDYIGLRSYNGPYIGLRTDTLYYSVDLLRDLVIIHLVIVLPIP